jgi:hypothetical protein
MGMCLSLAAVEASTIEKLLADPPRVWKVVAPRDEKTYRLARRPKASWLDRLLRRAPPPQAEPARVPPPAADSDLGKAWHGIHYLLSGSAWGGDWPASFLLLGGAVVARPRWLALSPPGPGLQIVGAGGSWH